MVATLEDESRCTPMLRCLACGSGSLVPYLDLGRQPLANDVHDGTIELAKFPLGLNRCVDCTNSQLTHAVGPDLLFRDYSYVSGTSNTLSAYFDDFVADTDAHFDFAPLSVMDIAGNDGSLLSKFAAHGHRVLNVDPAANLVATAEANGVPTICDYWDSDIARTFDVQFDVVVAMNVLGHVSDPLDFLVGCREVLTRDGCIYIQTSQAEMCETGQLDAVYSEHASYFTARSFLHLADRAGLVVQDVRKVPVHGVSYLWRLGLSGERWQSVWDLLQYEVVAGYYTDQTYRDFGDKAERAANFLYQVTDEYRDAGYAVVGYGAAAKGNVMLSFADVDLDFIVDENPLKIGLLTPGQDISIVGIDALSDIDEPLCMVVLCWNFYREVTDRVQNLRQRSDDVFVRTFPSPHVEAAWQQ